MSDPKEQQDAQEEQVAEDLGVPDEQAEDVRGGEVSLNFTEVKVTYKQQ